MTREEIMGMAERELYKGLVLFVDNKLHIKTIEKLAGQLCENLLLALGWCYQAEEKLKEMRLKSKHGQNLVQILQIPLVRFAEDDYSDNFWEAISAISSSHPRDRARAILLTVEESK